MASEGGMKGIIVFAGSSHAELAQLIVDHLGMRCGQLALYKFANQEIGVEIRESVRDRNVYIIQTCALRMVNDMLMELLVLVHACKIASAARVTVVLPYFPYSRHVLRPIDRPLLGPFTERQKALLAELRQSPTTTTTGYKYWSAPLGRLVASMVEAAGADHVFTLDLHNAQYQGFFNIPVDNLPIAPLMIKFIKESIADWQDTIIVSPDAGGAKRASELARMLGLDFALIHKTSTDAEHKHEDLVLVGRVRDRNTIIVDDMADTCTTLISGAAILRANGARRVYAAVSHGIFSGDAMKRIEESEIFEVIVSNTIPLAAHLQASSKVRVFDVSPLLAEAIRRAHNGESVSFLFDPLVFQ